MKKAIVKGFLYVSDRGTEREMYFHSITGTLPQNRWVELVMPCNFEVMVPVVGAVTPVVMLDTAVA